MPTSPREDLISIFQAGIEAVAPGPALLKHMKLEGDRIIADDHSFPVPRAGLYVTGGGKGAAPMAMALENLLGDRIKAGVIVVKYGHELELDKIRVLQAAHPVPDEAGQKGASACMEIARKCAPGDLLICLLTGGASALLPSPAWGLDLADLQAVTSRLLSSGASIDEINIIRKHLSSLSGGRLAEAANGANVLTLIVSDVLCDDPASIASGPTSPDPSTFADCLEIIDRYGLQDKIPTRVMSVLREGASGVHPETPKAENGIFKNVHNVIIASNRQALEACARKSEDLGYDTIIHTDPMSGEAADCARALLKEALTIRKKLPPDAKPVCLVAGGETTVSLTGTGKGGRNQEMALVAALFLGNIKGVYCLFAGTDGTDGPTDAAGGFASAQSVKKMGGREEAEKLLVNHDSYEALKRSGDHLITGPTRTNVMDIAIIIIYPEKISV